MTPTNSSDFDQEELEGVDKLLLYRSVIAAIFFAHWKKSVTEFIFERREIGDAARQLKLEPPGNLGDVPYSFRYRQELPDEIVATQPKGKEWIIEGAGRSRYRFRLAPFNRVLPRDNLVTIGVPDATPEIIRAYALDDEQALLAILRYNRLVDIFLGLASFSLQNHLRTTVKGVGQIEIDELYFGIDKAGRHYVIPLQAKGKKDKLGVVQAAQDLAWCGQKYPGLKCRALSTQFMTDNRIAMFELTAEGETVKVVDERHYKLLPARDLDRAAITAYSD